MRVPLRGGRDADSQSEGPKLGERRRGVARNSGCVSFGYFSLHKQRKVTRPAGRDRHSNNARGARTSQNNIAPEGVIPTLRPLLSQALLDVVEQTDGGLLDHIQNLLEAHLAPEIRIRHL